MRKRLEARRIVFLLTILALLIAGFAAMTFAPAIHATASSIAPHGILEQCPAVTYHC